MTDEKLAVVANDHLHEVEEDHRQSRYTPQPVKHREVSLGWPEPLHRQIISLRHRLCLSEP